MNPETDQNAIASEPPVPAHTGARRPDVPAVRARLSDGSEWWLASASHRIRPKMDGTGHVTVDHYFGFPPRAERAVVELGASIDPAADRCDVASLVRVVVELAAAAVDAPRGELAGRLDLDGSDLAELMVAVFRACRGESDEPDPAPAPDGGTDDGTV